MAFHFLPDLTSAYVLNPFLVPHSSDVSYLPLLTTVSTLQEVEDRPSEDLLIFWASVQRLLIFQILLLLPQKSLGIHHSLLCTCIPLCTNSQYHIFIVEKGGWVRWSKYSTTVWHLEELNQSIEG